MTSQSSNSGHIFRGAVFEIQLANTYDSQACMIIIIYATQGGDEKERFYSTDFILGAADKDKHMEEKSRN